MEPSTPGEAVGSTDGAAAGSFAAAFAQASAQTGVPVGLLEAVAATESGDNPTAVSSTGAEGIMQLEPATAAAMGVSDPWNAADNILGGADYLADQLRTFDGNVVDAVAAYNAGPGAVEQYGGIPPYAQTEAYVAAVLHTMASESSSLSKGDSL